MNIDPQDESAIIRTILRDTYKILTENSSFNFSYASEVKLQKLFFIIAEELDIPLTRSWYRYGGYVHNDVISCERLCRIPFELSLGRNSDVERAERLLRDIRSDYINLLHELVPKIFYIPLDEFLKDFYERAPKDYKPLYYSNMAIENDFKLVKNFNPESSKFWQNSIISYMSKDSKTDFSTYKRFANHISSLILEVSNSPDLSCLYEYTNKYAEMLDDCLIKMAFLGKKSLHHLNELKKTYEHAIWNTIALKISINTLTGVNAKGVKADQEYKFYTSDAKVNRRLVALEASLTKDNMLPSLDERKQFFNAVYGEDKEFLGAVSNVWKSYKEASC